MRSLTARPGSLLDAAAGAAAVPDTAVPDAAALDALVDVGRRLSAWEVSWGFEVGPCAPADGWVHPAQVSTELAAAWVERQQRELDATRAVAAAYVCWGMESRLVNAVTAAWLVGPVRPALSPAGLALQLLPTGRSTGVRFTAAEPVRSAGADDAERLGRELVATLTPMVTAARAASRFPLPLIWGMVADSVAGTAIRLATHLPPRPADQYWVRAQQVLAGMVQAGVRIGRRPRVLPTAGGALRMIRGTCCRYYATPEARHGPVEDRWCGTCPLAPANREPLTAQRMEHRLS